MAFLGNVFGKTSGGRKGLRRNHGKRSGKQFKRLALEQLEPRMMFSASASDNVLALASVSSGVTAPAAPSFTANAASGTQVNLSWNTVPGAKGYLVDEWINGAWTPISSLGSGVTTDAVMALSPGTGYTFEIGAYNSAGTSWANYQSVRTSTPVVVAVGAYTLSSGVLSRNGSVIVDTNVSSFTVGSDGKYVFWLKNDGTLWQAAANNSGVKGQLASGVSSFTVGSDAKYVFWLKNDGTLWDEGYGVTSELASNVHSFVVGSDAKYVFWLKNDGTLWDEGYGVTSELASNVHSFVLGSDAKYVFWLKNDGTLWDEGYGVTSELAGNVNTFVVGSDAKYVFWLKNDGTLWDEGYGVTSELASNVHSFVLGSDAKYVFWLKNDGTLWDEGYGVTSELASNVHSFVLGSDAKYVVWLKNDGTLWDEGYGVTTQIDSDVTSFQVSADASYVSWQRADGAVGQITFVAMNHPASTDTYTPVSGSLFGPNGPSYLDVEQGAEGDCWLMASLAEVAARDPADIRNMFTADGTAVENGSVVSLYTVRCFTNAGAAEYVTVDTELPAGGALYDHPINGVLWVALAEKAYAEANGASWVTTGAEGSDSYAALNGGSPTWALSAITGKAAKANVVNPANIAADWNAGDLIVLCSSYNAGDNLIVGAPAVGTHAYAVVNYTASSGAPFELYNPWGASALNVTIPYYGGQVFGGAFYTTAALISQDFAEQDVGAGAAPGLSGDGPQSLLPALTTSARTMTGTVADAASGTTLGIVPTTAGSAAMPAPSSSAINPAAVDNVLGALGEFGIDSDPGALAGLEKGTGLGKSLAQSDLLALSLAEILAG